MYDGNMKRRSIHVSETEAAKEFPSLLEQVRHGAEIIIEENAHPVAILQPAKPERRILSDCIARAQSSEERTGTAPILHPDFAADVEGIIRNRQPWNPPSWE